MNFLSEVPNAGYLSISLLTCLGNGIHIMRLYCQYQQGESSAKCLALCMVCSDQQTTVPIIAVFTAISTINYIFNVQKHSINCLV